MFGGGSLSQCVRSLSYLNYCVFGCVPQCNVSEMVLCLCSNIRGFRVSLCYVCSLCDYSELYFSLGLGD